MGQSKEGQPLLGDFELKLIKFKNITQALSRFKEATFLELNLHEKSNRVSEVLLDLIEGEKESRFLLRAITEYITCIKEQEILENYTFSSFELWLNQFSMLSFEDNYRIRGKIMGKWLPRDVYQTYFPIGMGKIYAGSHFVAAHRSPDLDTTIASFWGWVDAFSARVSSGLHLWNVPAGPSKNQVENQLLFKDLFGEDVFWAFTKTRLSLSLTSLDLMTQSRMSKKYIGEPALGFDYERQRNAVILIDKQGRYLGDWRTMDIEGVRQVVMGLNNCLMWIESNLHIKLISCFAKKELSIHHISHVIWEILHTKIRESDPAKEIPQTQLDFIHNYLVKVLGVEDGLDATFEGFALSIEKLEIVDFTKIITWIKDLVQSDLFDGEGILTENRPLIFNQLESLVKMVASAFLSIRKYVDRLEIALKIKTQVFGYSPQYLTHRTDIEEIRSKMGPYSYLTVNHTDLSGDNIPIGVVHGEDLQKETLGTVSLRDFCNREETKIPSYLEIISVIDHHKSDLSTNVPSSICVKDVQSANTLVAYKAFAVNDRYAASTLSKSEMEKKCERLEKKLDSIQDIRLYQKLLEKKKILYSNSPYYVDAQREFVEYLHFVYAILEDTDLLTKVSRFDVECMASLLNRLKSLTVKEEVEIVHFDDIAEDADFTKKLAKRLLQNKDFYSLYSKVYRHKEEAIDKGLHACIKKGDVSIFSDTKILNACNRVGQIKIFMSNYKSFKKYQDDLRGVWYQEAQKFYKNNPELMLHLHMVSTTASAEEVFQGKQLEYKHLDELWVWIPETDLSVERLKLFLNGFKSLPHIEELEMNVEFFGGNSKELSQIFKESFIDIPHKISGSENSLPIAVIRYKAGKLNSRKAMIAPYLPKGGVEKRKAV